MVGVCVASFFLRFKIWICKNKCRENSNFGITSSMDFFGSAGGNYFGGNWEFCGFDVLPPPFPGAVAAVFLFVILHRPIVSLMKTRNQRAARLWQRVPAPEIQAGFWVYCGTPWRHGDWVDKQIHSPAGRSHAAVH